MTPLSGRHCADSASKWRQKTAQHGSGHILNILASLWEDVVTCCPSLLYSPWFGQRRHNAKFEILDKIHFHCLGWVAKCFLLLQVWIMQLVLRIAAVEEEGGASLLFSLPPYPETSHANSATVCVLLHYTVMGAWVGDTSASAARTQSQTSSANLSVLLHVQTPRWWRYVEHSGLIVASFCYFVCSLNITFRISSKPSDNLPTTSLCGLNHLATSSD